MAKYLGTTGVFKRISLFLISIVVSFCITPELVAQSNTGNSKPTVDLVSAEKAIHIQIRAFENALKNGDSTAIGNLYTVDAKILNHGSPSTVGRDEIVKAFGEMIRDSITGSSFTSIGLWGSDELVVEEGTGYFAHVNGEVVIRGRYLCVWKKENGKWKIFRDTFFSDGKLKK